MLGKRDMFGRGAKGAAVTLGVEQPDPVAAREPRRAIAGLVDKPRAIAVRNDARKFLRAIARPAPADIGRSDAAGCQANTNFAWTCDRRRHLTIGEDVRRRSCLLVPDRPHSVPGKAPPSSRRF